MITRGMLKEYLKYIVPTMITFTLGGVYSIIDGVFVGHAVGDAGLAGINVAFPLVAFIMAVGTGVGMRAQKSPLRAERASPPQAEEEASRSSRGCSAWAARPRPGSSPGRFRTP